MLAVSFAVPWSTINELLIEQGRERGPGMSLGETLQVNLSQDSYKLWQLSLYNTIHMQIVKLYAVQWLVRSSNLKRGVAEKLL